MPLTETALTSISNYDSRGLLISYKRILRPPLPIGRPRLTLRHKTTYTYWAAADGQIYYPWIDRVKTVTFPANVSGLQASETYQYERSLDTTTGITNLKRSHCGRPWAGH